MNIQKRKIIDINVSALDYSSALCEISYWIDKGIKEYVCVSAVHLLMECQKDLKLREGVNKAGMVTTDGMPLVWVMKYLWGFKKIERIYGPDLMLKLCKLSLKKNYKVFLLGGSKGESSLVAEELKRKFKNLKIVGNIDTPIRPIPNIENSKIISILNSKKPDIVFVGLGCPLQEKWMIENRKKLNINVLIGVGAAFDFISGKSRQANKVLQRLGLEWLYRLMHDPKRLWYRYTVYNFQFVVLLIKDIFKLGFLKKDN